MPTVPQYGGGEPRVQAQRLRTGQARGVSPTAGTGPARQLQQVGQQISRTGAQLTDIAIQQQTDRNASMVLAAKTAFDAEAAKVIVDARNQRGMNAWGLTDRTDEWYKSSSQRYIDNLENDAQKQAMRQVFAEKWPSIKSNIYGHEVSEQRRAVNDSAKAAIQSATDFGVANHNDPALLQQSVADIQRTVLAQQAINEGWTAEVADAALQSHLTALHKSVIDAKLDADPRAAEAYYEANREQIRGVDQPVIEEKLATGKRILDAQEFVDEQELQGATEEEQLKKARTQFEGEAEEEAIAEVTRRFSQKQAAITRDQQAAYREADQVLFEGGNYSDIPNSLLGRLSRADRGRLRDEQYGKVTDWPTYYGLRQVAAREPSTFASMDLTPYFGKLDDAKRAEMIKLQTKAAKDPADLALGRTKWQVMQQSAANAGLDPSKDKEDNSAGEKVREYYRRVDDEILEFYNEKGKEPNREQLLQITDNLSREVVQSGWIWDTERPAALAEVEGVPTEMVDNLAEQVAAQNREVTDENIKKLYDYLVSIGQI